MKKLALFSLIFINTCYADQLTSYQDTVNALNNGKHITFVIDWDQCKTNAPDEKPNFSSSYQLINANISKFGFIQSIGSVYTYNYGRLSQLGAVYQAYVYTLKSNNELNVIDHFIDPITSKEKIPALEATCQLGDGFKIFD